MATSFECCPSCSVWALFSWKAVALFSFKVFIKPSQSRAIFSTSKMEFFVTITIDKTSLCWLIVIHTQYPPMNFLPFVPVCCWFNLFPGDSGLFQLVPGGSRRFQLVPRFNIYGEICRRFDIITTFEFSIEIEIRNFLLFVLFLCVI